MTKATAAPTAESLVDRVCSTAAARYPHSQLHGHVTYGTAGFRTKANSQLASIVYRMGLLASLRSRALHGAAIGVMITASHNPEGDNGVKLVDPLGEMLCAEWEPVASGLACALDSELRNHLLVLLSTLHSGDGDSPDAFVRRPSRVVIGQDTRQSSPELAEAAANGVGAFGGQVARLGLCTTPQLHYVVACRNRPEYGEASEEGYYVKLADAYRRLAPFRRRAPSDGDAAPLWVDAANGVGADKLRLLQRQFLHDLIDIRVGNDGTGSGAKLNHNCGADFVKVQMQFPHGDNLQFLSGHRWAAFDGDADRIVYFYRDGEGRFQLLDGDKIATLLAGHLTNLARAAELHDLQVGLVQTAYANAASTRYIADELGAAVACVPTGVKHLHLRAKQFDLGVYFEANGHGTVLFSERATAGIARRAAEGSEAASELRLLLRLTNQTVGDAISVLLLVEHTLAATGLSVQQWNACYTDLPSRQLKVQVANRNLVTTTDAERRCVLPDGLQERIDQLVAGQQPHARAFVRPSGTEDVVRVYAEAADRSSADRLALSVANAVHQLADGVGELPKLSE